MSFFEPFAAFEVPAAMRDLLDRARAFVDTHVLPVEAKLMAHGGHGGAFAAHAEDLAAMRDAARSQGLWLPQMPKGVGGMGLSLVEHGLLTEVLGRSALGLYAVNAQAPDAGNMEILHDHATPEQRRRFLDPLLAGEIRSCFSMTEPEHAGSNPVVMSTVAERDGDEWVVTGHKWFTTAADGAAFAIVMAVTNPDAPPHQRASMIFVPTETPGFERVRNIAVMGEAGDGWMSHAEVRYHGCRVPASYVLGEPGHAFTIAQERLGPGRIHHCMRWLGIAERAYEMMVERAADRDMGRGRPLASKQLIQGWLAESLADIAGARLMVLAAAKRIEQAGAKHARVDISMIKYRVANVMQTTLDRAIQVHGALGMTDDTPLAWYWRHERAGRIYDGPDEVHKGVVARKVMQRLDEARAMGRMSLAPQTAAEREDALDALIDAPKAELRTKAVFDTGALERWLADHQPELSGPVSVAQYPSGYSNLTYLLRIGEADGGQDVVLRRAPPGVKIKSAHDMGREFRILSALGTVWGKVPRTLAQCEDPEVIGSPFYLMERVRGMILRGKVPKGLHATKETWSSVADSLIGTLVEIHGLDWKRAGLDGLGRPEGYVERQVTGWRRRYEKAKTDDISAMEKVADWLAAQMPGDSDATVVHNDFKLDNVILDPANPANVLAVLDWEMATIGDPLMDLGVALAYWIQKDDPPAMQMFRFGLTHLEGMPTRMQVAERYAERTGRDVSNIAYYYVFAVYKVAVVLQQLYKRHTEGKSSDPRHAGLIHGVRGFGDLALKAIATGRIDGF